MTVGVYETRHDVFTRGINLDISLWPCSRPAAERHRIEGDDARNAPALNHDVLWSRCRRPVAFDDDGVADDQTRVAMSARDPGVRSLSAQAERGEQDRQ